MHKDCKFLANNKFIYSLTSLKLMYLLQCWTTLTSTNINIYSYKFCSYTNYCRCKYPTIIGKTLKFKTKKKKNYHNLKLNGSLKVV